MYSHLDKINTGSAAEVAKNIRKDLKHHFPKIKFSVRTRHYDSVAISWTNGPTNSAVEKVLNKYEGGSFNGMEDIYEYNTSEFNGMYGSVKYISTTRDTTDELIGLAIKLLSLELEKKGPTVAEFRSGHTQTISPYDCWSVHHSWQALIHDKLSSINYTDGYKPRVKPIKLQMGWYAELDGAFISASLSSSGIEACRKVVQLI